MSFEKVYQDSVEKYRERTKASETAYKKACKYMPGGETRSISWHYPYPITVEYGKGCYIYDADGNEYIDYINNYTSLIHGHANPHVTSAINKAAACGTAVCAGLYEQVKLAEILCERTPGIERIRFCNSGTEAVMFALRAARAFTGKNGIIKAIGGYHGTTDTVEFSVSPKSPEDALSMVPVPDFAGISKNAAKDIYVVSFNNLQAVEDVLKKNSDDIACMIVEPFLGSGGVIPAAPGYLEGLRKLCSKYGVLLVFDEMQSFRLSTGGAQEKYNVIPDITVIGKIIGGGLPVGAFGASSEIMDVYSALRPNRISQSGTFNGNRATMAAGIAAMELYDKAAVSRLEDLACMLEQFLNNTIQKLKLPACVTRDGSIMNIHFTEKKPVDFYTAMTGKKQYFRLYILEMLQRGIFTAPRGTLALSTAMTDKDVKKAAEAFEGTMTVLAPFLT